MERTRLLQAFRYLKIVTEKCGATTVKQVRRLILIRLLLVPLHSLRHVSEYISLKKRSKEAKAGTLGALIAQYKAHPSFTDLATKTQQDYDRYFNYLKDIENEPLIKFNPPLVVRIRGKIAKNHGRRSGNYMKTVLSIIFAWGKERGLLDTNPAADIKALKRPKDAGYANRPWTDSEREAVLAALPKHMKLPIIFMMFCGLDPQDALRLPKSAIADGKIDVRRGKTGVPVWLPLPYPVIEAMDAANVHETNSITLCVNSRGQPWTVSGFRAS